jgi:hypothetical protein
MSGTAPLRLVLMQQVNKLIHREKAICLLSANPSQIRLLLLPMLLK